MSQFIHLTDERLLKRLEKSGIRTTKWGTKVRCVYATPVLKDFQVSHQWLRELKNKGIRTIGAVQVQDTGQGRGSCRALQRRAVGRHRRAGREGVHGTFHRT